MATVNKDFKIKSGLVVEGLQGTINNQRILTEVAGDQYILDLIGGETLVKSVEATQLEVSVAGKLSVKAEVFDDFGSAAAAYSAAESFATSADTAVRTAVTTEIGTAKSEAIAAAAADATGKANAALATANAYTDAAETREQTNRNNAIANSISDLNLANTYDAKGSAAQALVDSKAYTDQEVSALVDSAPELLDTLNELAAAIADNPNYATDVANLVATKADTTYVDSEISDLGTAALAAADAAEAAAIAASALDATAKADAAEAAAALDATAKADAAEAAAIAYADALNTDNVGEGEVNEYFTDARAKDSAAYLLTGATKTNITITGTGAGLTITAENGVADSDTDDLVEGSTNKYFTDVRAVDALEAVVPNFTAVEVNSVAKQVASTMSATSAGAHVGHAFAKADYRSAEFLVKVAYGTHTEISKVLLTLDSSDNIAMTEYGIVGTNGSASSVSANVDGANVQLLVTTTNNNSTVTVVGTLLA